MRPSANIDELIKKLQLKASAELDKRVHDDISAALTKSEQTKSVHAEPNIWRIIMRSRIPKLAAAAVIIIAVLFGVSIFKDSSGVAWGKVLNNVQKIKSCIHRMRMTVTAGPEQTLDCSSRVSLLAPACGWASRWEGACRLALASRWVSQWGLV